MKLNSKVFQAERHMPVKKGNAGYDNQRENIDPHIKTQAVSTREIVLSDGAAEGFVKNDANGHLTGGHAGASTVEGTDVLSTGEGGGTKFLREDGDGTCSWQTIAGGGDMTKAVYDTNDDGTVDAADTAAALTGAQADAIVANTAKVSCTTANVTSAGALMDSEVDADIKTLALPANTTISAFGKTLVDDADAGTARTTLGLGTMATKNSIDIGDDTNLTAGTNITLSGDTLNVDDAFIKNNADDTSTHKITAANFAVTGDNNTNDSSYVPMVLHGTDATPPTASGFPRGTIYIQYTA